MTILDIILKLPIWLQVIAFCLLTIWGLEMFFLPFRINSIHNIMHTEQMELLRKIASSIDEKKNNDISKETILSMLLNDKSNK